MSDLPNNAHNLGMGDVNALFLQQFKNIDYASLVVSGKKNEKNGQPLDLVEIGDEQLKEKSGYYAECVKANESSSNSTETHDPRIFMSDFAVFIDLLYLKETINQNPDPSTWDLKVSWTCNDDAKKTYITKGYMQITATFHSSLFNIPPIFETRARDSNCNSTEMMECDLNLDEAMLLPSGCEDKAFGDLYRAPTKLKFPTVCPNKPFYPENSSSTTIYEALRIFVEEKAICPDDNGNFRVYSPLIKWPSKSKELPKEFGAAKMKFICLQYYAMKKLGHAYCEREKVTLTFLKNWTLQKGGVTIPNTQSWHEYIKSSQWPSEDDINRHVEV